MEFLILRKKFSSIFRDIMGTSELNNGLIVSILYLHSSPPPRIDIEQSNEFVLAHGTLAKGALLQFVIVRDVVDPIPSVNLFNAI